MEEEESGEKEDERRRRRTQVDGREFMRRLERSSVKPREIWLLETKIQSDNHIVLNQSGGPKPGCKSPSSPAQPRGGSSGSMFMWPLKCLTGSSSELTLAGKPGSPSSQANRAGGARPSLHGAGEMVQGHGELTAAAAALQHTTLALDS
ncbi:unnamed protein product [Pleuronectes platessa]|uniref:Uncharacterized protein n=1 Tax=Pleuronectes platessa TaxID=8262 RepID=A0A9N7VLP6_PLEPL|nr:unnamed protein product [Pleuronectes platessa]